MLHCLRLHYVYQVILCLSSKIMATVLRKIDWTIRLSALATLILGILMIASSFRIKYYNEALDSNTNWWKNKNYKQITKTLMGLYCSTNLFASWIIYWPGFVVCIHIFSKQLSSFFYEDVLA